MAISSTVKTVTTTEIIFCPKYREPDGYAWFDTTRFIKVLKRKAIMQGLTITDRCESEWEIVVRTDKALDAKYIAKIEEVLNKTWAKWHVEYAAERAAKREEDRKTAEAFIAAGERKTELSSSFLDKYGATIAGAMTAVIDIRNKCVKDAKEWFNKKDYGMASCEAADAANWDKVIDLLLAEEFVKAKETVQGFDTAVRECYPDPLWYWGETQY